MTQCYQNELSIIIFLLKILNVQTKYYPISNIGNINSLLNSLLMFIFYDNINTPT